ncbi:maleylpyruvate isomerase N-terminal domain-containing protein [Amycolatopsis umgeniensis]|uniref:Uncharacterized protein (TIGR03086 family) n=1 Tax=Amycolatopsis umgeniensis TaxID=336628 RepID=A0A841BG37_9PSEU|nr:maleylpyruvate isomerase N-terminal domain-containing protein [Amycolatopsis umgeniensis]MBB5857532.1 uncharacterized protein (TIGR03086 family) [Amycolatopsis umgeniensis]
MTVTTTIDGLGLLKRALNYALGTAQRVTPEMLTWPTPCEGWNLELLLLHFSESLDALHEGVSEGCVRVTSAPESEPVTGAVSLFRGRACRLLRTCVEVCQEEQVVTVADRPMSSSILAATGALEVAVHGWDIAMACRTPQRIPDDLATTLLELAPAVVTDATRHSLFAPAVATRSTQPSDRLVTLLGRTPY